MDDDDVYYWLDNEAHQSGFVAEDDMFAAIFPEERTPTQPYGSGNEWEHQIQGAADGVFMTGNHLVLEIPPERISQEIMNRQKLVEEISPTQHHGSGRTSEDAVGLPGPSSSRGFDDLSSNGILASALPQETVKRQRNTRRENGKRRSRGINWTQEETSSFLKHMETAVVEKHKPPWEAVSKAMERDGYKRDKSATKNRWRVLEGFDTDNNDSISPSRGVPVGWRQSMMRIYQERRKSSTNPATPPTPSPPSGGEIEELSSTIDEHELIDKKEFIELMKMIRMLMKAFQQEQKTRKRKR